MRVTDDDESVLASRKDAEVVAFSPTAFLALLSCAVTKNLTLKETVFTLAATHLSHVVDRADVALALPDGTVPVLVLPRC